MKSVVLGMSLFVFTVSWNKHIVDTFGEVIETQIFEFKIFAQFF